ncbi:MAG: trypsin-like peptidase domain-containing protein [Salibacteraceae bacterium]
MLRFQLLIALGLLPALLWAQQTKVILKTIPSSAVVLIDGDSAGSASDNKVYIGFNEQKKILEHRITIAAKGYKSYTDTITFPAPKNLSINIELERNISKVNRTPAFHIGIDSLISGLPYYTEVGDYTRWKFHEDELLEPGFRHGIMLKLLNEIGFETSDSIRSDSFPEVVIKARVEAFSIRRGFASKNYEVANGGKTSRINMHWKFYDRINNKEIIDETVTTIYEYKNIQTTEAFYNAVVENFTMLFIEADELITVLENYEVHRQIEPIDRFEEAEGDSGEVLLPSGEVMEIAGDSAIKVDAEGKDNATAPKPGQRIVESDQSGIPSSYRLTIPKPEAINMVSSAKLNNRLSESVVSVISEDQKVSSGFLISEKGHIMAYLGELLESESVVIQFFNGVMLKAQVLERSAVTGFALLKVDAEEFNPIRLGSVTSESIRLKYIKSPVFKSLRFTTVQISSLETITFEEMRLMTISKEIETIDIGSPLFSSNGEVLGVLHIPKGESHGYALYASDIFNVLSVGYE